jgi:hypothetical protein
LSHRNAEQPGFLRRWALVVWAGYVLALAVGCGLNDYEKRMAAEQKRLERFDRIKADEDKYLGDPVDVPHRTVIKTNNKGEEVKVQVRDIPLDFFLLPPKDIGPRPSRHGGPVFTYSGRAPIRIFVAAMEPGTRPEEFKDRVCENVGIPPRQAKQETRHALGGQRLEFDLVDHADRSFRYLVYILRRDRDRFAVVYKVEREKADDGAVRQAITASVRSLEVGDRASLLRNALQRADRKASYYRLRLQAR